MDENRLAEIEEWANSGTLPLYVTRRIQSLVAEARRAREEAAKERKASSILQDQLHQCREAIKAVDSNVQETLRSQTRRTDSRIAELEEQLKQCRAALELWERHAVEGS